MMIAIASFSRSQRRSRIQQLLTIYFRSCGLSAKAFDTLSALGITMSQKWVYSAVDTLSKAAIRQLTEDIQRYRWYVSHDNLNLSFRTYEQRINNKHGFDSGTAATVFVVKTEPRNPPLDGHALRQQRVAAAENPLTPFDILMLEVEAAPAMENRDTFRILRFLLESPEFDYDTYKHHGDVLFVPPDPVDQLPTGREHATCQYMVDTMHVNEATSEGNEEVMTKVLDQLGITTDEAKKHMGEEEVAVWIGDQLTVSRLRGLKKDHACDLNAFERLEHVQEQPGWFHMLMAVEHNLYKQYKGTHNALGLSHAIDLLKRKGLSAASIKGQFHHNIEELLLHVTTAHGRDLWRTVGKVESLKALRSRTPAELWDLASEIRRDYASTSALDAMSRLPRDQLDDLHYQMTQFMRDALGYLDLHDAMKSGDVGCMEQHLPRLFFRFVGGMNHNYQAEVLYLLHGLHREWTPDVKYVLSSSGLDLDFSHELWCRNFIRKHCWLTNRTGQPNNFLPLDQVQENNVGDIKARFLILKYSTSCLP